MDNSKIDRIENQLSQLQSAMIMIARSDEKLLYVVERLKEHDNRLSALEDQNASSILVLNNNTNTSRAIIKLAWLIVGGLFAVSSGILVFMFQRGFG